MFRKKYSRRHGRKYIRYYYREMVALAVLLVVIAATIFVVRTISLKNQLIKEYQGENAELQKEVDTLSGELSKMQEGFKEETGTEPSGSEDGTQEDSRASGGSGIDRAAVEQESYTYFQGPWAWKNRLPWSGRWGKEYYDGASFGNFGCGLVCMANIYSTLTEYEASPSDMYQYAKKTTEYGGGGAIDWPYMKQAMESFGMECRLEKKPESYKEFRESVAEGKCAIALIWSYECNSYWQNNDGHYVTLYGYDAETEEVFLGDSGDPDHNRHWVSLDKIYASLKSVNRWQLLNVLSYDSQKCEWKNVRAGNKWVRPE